MTQPQTNAQMQLEFLRRWVALAERHGDRFELTVCHDVMLAVIGCLQLSLRHPSNTGPSANKVRFFIEGFIDAVEREDSELARLLRMGYDPAFDVRRDQ